MSKHNIQTHTHTHTLSFWRFPSTVSTLLTNTFIIPGKSRKKRGTNTVESLNPSRAPVGILLTGPEPESAGDGDCDYPQGGQSATTEPHGIDSPFANLSVNPLLGEDPARIRSYSSNSVRPALRGPNYHLSPGQSTIHTPSTSRSDPRNPVFSSQAHGSKNNSERLSPFFCPKHRARSAGATPLSKDTLMGRNIAKQARHPMAPSGPSLGSQARAAELNAAAAARARNFNRGFEDVNNHALPKSVSLGSLAPRAPTRNRRTNTLTPLSFEDAQEASPPGIYVGGNHPAMNRALHPPGLQFPGPLQLNPPNPTMAPHPLRSVSDMEPNAIREHRSIPTGPSRQRTPHWLHEMHPHMQASMLGSPGYHGPAHGHSTSPHHRQPAAIPAPKAFVSLRGPPLFGPDDISPEKQEQKSSFRGVQDGTVSQNPLHEDPFMAGQPYHQYGPPPLPFTPQPDLHIAYGYGAPVYSPQPGQMECHFTPQEARREDDQYVAYAPAPPLASHVAGLTGPNAYDMAAIGSTVHTQIRPRNEIPAPDSSMPEQSVMAESKALQLFEDRPRTEEDFDTKREMAAFLNSVVDASRMDMEDTEPEETLRSKKKCLKLVKFQGLKVAASQGARHFPHVVFASSHPRQPTNTLSCDADTRHAVLAKLTSQAGFQKCPRITLKSTKVASMESLLSIPMPGKFDITCNKEENSGFKFPPPGLPFPINRGLLVSFDPRNEPKPPAGSRLEQSNHWFHTDNRGEQRDRFLVANIVKQDYLRRQNARSFGCDAIDHTLADASNVLLGGVLTNLNSYLVGEPRAQFGSFARFGDVPASACEPSIGNHRSFFDYDPSRSWGSQPRLAEQRYQYGINGPGADEARFLSSYIS